MKFLRPRLHIRSVFAKFVLAFVLVGLIPLGIFSFFFIDRFSQSVSALALSNARQMVVYASDNLSKVYQDYNGITQIMYTYNASGVGELSDVIKKAGSVDANAVLTRNRYRQLMSIFTQNMLQANPYIQNVIFIDHFNKDISLDMRDRSKLFRDTFDFEAFHGYAEALTQKKQMTFFLPHEESYFARSGGKVMTFMRNLLDLNEIPSGETVLGTLWIDVNLRVFEDVFSRFSLLESGEVYLMDENGNCIYTRDERMIGSQPPWFSPVRSVLMDPSSDGYLRENDTHYVYQVVPSAGWRLVYRVDESAFGQRVRDMRNLVLLIFGFSLLGLILLAMVFSQGLSRPIKRMMWQMKRVESGNLDVSVDVRTEDEVGQLGNSFNRMVQMLGEHVQREYIARIGQREAELNALRTQIRPHFLYNTLEVIRMSAVDNSDEPVADMIHALSAQLRYTIDSGHDTVRLDDEMQMIRSYFQLVAVRFEGRISMEESLRAGTGAAVVPKLILQPVVENAVAHGLKPRSGAGCVRIETEIREGMLEISVTDDGNGMTPEQLESVTKRLESDAPGEPEGAGWKHLGLKNVQDRLKFLYGEGSGISIQSAEHVGTRVTLKLPLMTGDTGTEGENI